MLLSLSGLVLGSVVLATGPTASAATPTPAAARTTLGAPAGSSQVKSLQLTRAGQTGGVFTHNAPAASSTATPASQTRTGHAAEPTLRGTGSSHSTAASSRDIPFPTVSCMPRSSGCNGISTASSTIANQRYALNATANGNLYNEDVEPPDQAMCAGNGYVMEGINIGEIQVFNASLNAVSGYTKLDDLMGLTARNWSSGGDVTCQYDPDNGGHWFINEIVSTTSEANGGPFTGCFAGTKDSCREGIAVSTNNNPLSSSWNIYFLDPNKVSPNDQGAGYLLNDYGKQGNTRDAWLFGYDEFILNPKYIPPCPAFGCISFNGAQELAFQKKALELGYNTVNAVHENMGTDPFIQPPDGNCSNGPGAGTDCWAAVIPAGSPDGDFNNSNGGTGFMSAALDFNSFATLTGNGDDRVAVFYWTGLTNLNSFNCNACQAISFGGQILSSEPYTNDGQECPASQGDPCSVAPQRLGTIDLGTWCGKMGLAKVSKCPEQGIATNGDFEEQSSYANGHVWFSLSTLLNETFGSSSEIHTGAAYFIVDTSKFNASQQLLTLQNQGYVAAAHEDLSMPTLVGGAPGDGGVISFTLSGNGGPTRADGGGFYPSLAYGRLTVNSNGLLGGTIHVTNVGAGPQDGFSEYQGLPGPTRPRWGDYEAAIFVPGVGFYFAGEDIQYANCNPNYWFYVDQSCNGTRDPFANFGTSISLVAS